MKYMSLIEKIPQFIALKANYEKNPWHDETTYEHTMSILTEYSKYIKIKKPPFKNRQFDNQDNYKLFELVILLHDIAKPKTKQLNEKNETYFPDHEKEGSLLTEKILKKLNFDEQIISYITEIIKYHGEPHRIFDDRQNYQTKFAKLKSQIPNTYKETVFLAMIDTIGSKLRCFNKEEYDFRMEKYQELLD